MGVRITARYLGDGQVELTHGPSGSRWVTDLPVDNGGKGRTFSPTDAFAGALSSCVLTIMAKVAEREGVDFKGAAIDLEKEMGENPRRVAGLRGRIRLPEGLSGERRRKLLACVEACPVHKSLHPQVRVELGA